MGLGIVIALLAAAAAAVAALGALSAARAGREAVLIARRERLRDHWRRLAEAIDGVRRAADEYRAAMERGLELANGHEPTARRAEAVRTAARDYRDACARLRVTLAGGPTPPRWRRLLPELLDERRPEAVAGTTMAEVLLEEIGAIQDRLAREDEADRLRGSGPGEAIRRRGWALAAWLRMARLRALGRRPPAGAEAGDGRCERRSGSR
ncbi:MAG: hypothetical protein QOK40_637 [Miltoncostaeaceae bacterium]|nr:hypothetical protein [Miltoncostaeaceae bacterium]